MAKKVTLWSAGTLATLGAVVVVFAMLVPAATTNAVPCIPDPCPSGQPFSTGGVWGLGSTCAAAESDAKSQARSIAISDCGQPKLICNYQFVTTTSCWWNNSKGQFQFDGFAKYNCTDCSPLLP